MSAKGEVVVGCVKGDECCGCVVWLSAMRPRICSVGTLFELCS